MKKSIAAYEELINPVYIRQQIQTDEQFKEWCRNALTDDLENALEVFVKEEMYEDCSIIRDVLKKRKLKKEKS